MALLSALILAATGYTWSFYRQLSTTVGTSDVFGAAPRSADGATDILLVGLDSRTDAHGNPLPQEVLDQLNAGPDEGTLNTDTLILVRIPDDPARTATAVSIPRDSYVAIPGYGTHKINSAYARAVNDGRRRLQTQGVSGATLAQRTAQDGRRSLIATVEALTGSSIDHYAEVNLAGFAEVTRAVGGVPVCLNNPVHDSFSGAEFPAGPQTLQGAPALAFVRQRHGLLRGDLDRIVRQQAFLASLAHQVLSAGTLGNPATLSGLITAAARYIVLDQGWDLAAFATQAQGLTGGQITFQTIPTGRPDLPTPDDGDAVAVDPTAVRRFITDLTTSGPAAPGSAASGDPTAPRPATDAAVPVTVDVVNGSGRTGKAAAAQAVLTAAGFIPGAVGNRAATARSVIRAAPGLHEPAGRVAQLLGGLPVRDDATIAPGHVQVVLGADFTRAPTPEPATSEPAAPDRAGEPAPTPSDRPAVITADGTPCVN